MGGVTEMPRTAIQFGRICTVSLCLIALSGCLINNTFQPVNTFQPYGQAGILPTDQIVAIPSGSPGSVQPNDSPPAPGTLAVLNSTNGQGETTVLSNGMIDANVPTTINRSSRNVPDLGHIYGRTAKADDRDRNPIIVIPGVLGSRLVDQRSQQVVWGQFGGSGIDPRTPWGAELIGLKMRPGEPLRALTDDVRPAGTLDSIDIQFLGIPFQVNAYRDLLVALGVGGYRDAQTNLPGIDYGNQSYSSFQFAYDWRRDNVENARLLHEFILEKKAYVENLRRTRYGDDFPPVRFDIVAHSMGGLIARYYLEYGDADLPEGGSLPEITWKGAQHVERLVMVGTPNAGSSDAIANLVQGETLSRFLPRYEAAILGTMPSLYQLLPRSRQSPVIAEGDRRAVDLMEPRTWAQFRWGLLDPRQATVLAQLLPEVSDPNERQQIAYDHLIKCLARARAFHAAMDAPAAPPEGTSMHLIAGDAHPTISQYRVDRRGTLTLTGMQPGDGRVTRPSALMDERYSAGVQWTPRLNTPIKWASVNFLFADHLGLTSDPGFTDNILFLLLESPR